MHSPSLPASPNSALHACHRLTTMTRRLLLTSPAPAFSTRAGKAFADCRDDVVITTKFGIQLARRPTLSASSSFFRPEQQQQQWHDISVDDYSRRISAAHVQDGSEGPLHPRTLRGGAEEARTSQFIRPSRKVHSKRACPPLKSADAPTLPTPRRLNTTYIDLFICCRMDAETPIEETMLALKELVNEARCAPDIPRFRPCFPRLFSA